MQLGRADKAETGRSGTTSPKGPVERRQLCHICATFTDMIQLRLLPNSLCPVHTGRVKSEDGARYAVTTKKRALSQDRGQERNGVLELPLRNYSPVLHLLQIIE